MKFLTFFVLFSFPLLAHDNFVRGVFQYWGTNVDYTQMHDSLHINRVLKELSKRMLAKTPPNLRRFIIDVNKYPLIRLKKADKGLQILYVRQTQ